MTRLGRATVLFGIVVAGHSPEARAAERAAPPRDKAFWLAIARNDYRVPEGESADALVQELNPHLASTDPRLRDDCAYSIAAAWIYRDKRLSDETLRSLLTTWTGNLHRGLGETGADQVFLRSFSALDLSTLAALESTRPFLGETGFASLLSSALAYLEGERDLRDFDPQKGWIHATAHTADLLKFLGRSPRLRVADQARILEAVGGKIRAAGRVFVYGENERLARALESLALRPDFDRARFSAWLEEWNAEGKRLWADGPAIDPARYAPVQNAKDLLRSLYVDLALRGHDTPAVEEIRGEILRALAALE